MDKKKVVKSDASVDATFDGRAVISVGRDDSKSIKVGEEMVGKIAGYKFKILVRNKPAIEGEFTREEVDLMFRLYSAEGSNLTQRTISRYFPNYTFQDFKKILKAFGLTKASAPIAPHVMEEKTTDELIALTLQNKENDFLRKLEQDRTRLTETKLREMTGKYYDLKQQAANFSEFLGTLNITGAAVVNTPLVKNDVTIMVYLSDMHIGASVSDYSIYGNNFNYETATERLFKIYEKARSLALVTGATNIIVCNNGDALDGYNAETTRGGHALPQNMNNKDQFKNYIQMMTSFFSNLTSCGQFENIKYISVEGGNHDGDFGFMANKALESVLNIVTPNIEVRIFEKYIEHFTVGVHTFVLCHGKDAKDVFKNMPLVINDKTENQIREYLDYNEITGKNVHFIKGDLHQSATTYAKKFRYKAVASFFGSSEWIHKNFGNTPPACDFDIVDGDSILETRLILK